MVTRSASASPVDEKRREAERIANQIESLTDQSFDLGEEYDRVATELAQVDIEVAAAQKRVTELEAQVGSMRTAMQGVAVQSYIYGVQGEGVAAIIGGAGGPAIAAQREQYTELVLGSSVSQIDELETVSQDATRERQNLEEKQAKKRTLQEALAAKQAEVDASIQKARALESTVKGQLATLVAQEQARRAQQAAARARQASPSQPRPATARSPRDRTARHRSRRAHGPAPTFPPPRRGLRAPSRPRSASSASATAMPAPARVRPSIAPV